MNFKRICLLFAILLCSVSLSACGGPEATYKQAQSLLSKGQYAEAAEKFESIGSYEDAATLTMYCKACALCESGDFETGIQALERLGDYKDCTMRITYYTARSWDDSSVGTTEYEWMQRAKSIYSENPLYLDSAARISALDDRIVTAKQSLYNNAVQAGDNGRYSTAIQIFERLSDYSDSEQRYTYYNIRADETALTTSTDETAVFAVAARYEQMGEYLDCMERVTVVKSQAIAILDNKYNAAVELMNIGKYAEAITAFTEIKTHKDSTDQIKVCETAILDNKYNAAVELMNAGKYNEAIAVFTEIKTHKDSMEQINVCENAILDEKYNAAVALMTEEKYKDAYDAFASLDGYKDSTEQALRAYQKHNLPELEKASVGSYITFGVYEQDANTANGKEAIEWLVLDKQDDRILIISKYGLDCRPYNEKRDDVTWETCTLRKWLNKDFLNAAFNGPEQAMILTVTVTADKNPYYSTNPGNATQDMVFLLSIPEANKYFTSDSARACKPTAYAKMSGARNTNASGFCFWWMRSPGGSGSIATLVGREGGISGKGTYVDDDVDGVVRPALWINLIP